jgi:2-polyprenyl-3-methyl-5-hydroxy-6-metoxy-1,4-benzoquinol methylase
MGENEIITGNDGFKWKLEERPCPVCQSENFSFKGKRGGEYHRAKKGAVANIVKCKNCSLLYAQPTLVPIGNPYEGENDYFELHDSKWKQDFGEQLTEKIEKIIGKKGRIIEPACGLGDFLLGAKNRGWEARGVEMTQFYADAAGKLGLDVEVASVENSEYLKEKYDAMFMIAMLEHLYQPAEMLKIAYNALNPGGVIVINVPNELSSTVNRLGNIYIKSYGKDWTMSLSPTFSPYHVVGFSPKSLQFALEKTGFELIEMTTHSGTNVLPVKGFRQKIESIGLTASLLIGKISDKIGMGNEIICWAKKPM